MNALTQGSAPAVDLRVRENLFRMGLMFTEFQLFREDAQKIPQEDLARGMAAVNRHHTIDSVTDGLSTTVMLSENVNAGVGSTAAWTKNATFCQCRVQLGLVRIRTTLRSS